MAEGITIQIPAVPFSEEYNIEAFRCEQSSVNAALQVMAASSERWDRSRTYLLLGLDDDSAYFIAGFFTIHPGIMPTEDLPQEALPEDLKKEDLPGELPIIYLAFLGRDQRFRGMGLGDDLMGEVMVKAVEASNIVGGVGIYAVAISEEAVRLNTTWGFHNLDPENDLGCRMFLPMSAARQVVQESV